jgi:hypothetical protein
MLTLLIDPTQVAIMIEQPQPLIKGQFGGRGIQCEAQLARQALPLEEAEYTPVASNSTLSLIMIILSLFVI